MSYIEMMFYHFVAKYLVTILYLILFTLLLVVGTLTVNIASAFDNTSNKKLENIDRIIIKTPKTIKTPEGEIVVLDGRESYDTNGDSLSFFWKQLTPANFKVVLSDSKSAITSFVAPSINKDTKFVFQLILRDGHGNTDNEKIQVLVTNKEDKNKIVPHSPQNTNTNDDGGIKKPFGKLDDKKKDIEFDSKRSDHSLIVRAGDDLQVISGMKVGLAANVLPEDEVIKINWGQIQGVKIHLSSNSVLNPTFRAPNVDKPKTVQLRVYVIGDSNTASDTISIKIYPKKEQEVEAHDGSTVTTPNLHDSQVKIQKPGFNNNSQITTKSNEKISATSPVPLQATTMAVYSDSTPPSVITTSPANGDRNIPTGTSVKATFSEPILSSSVSSSTFTIRDSSTSAYISGARTVSSTDGGKSVIFTPSSKLNPSTTYIVTLTTGIKDLAGNAMTSKKIWYFITSSDLSPPSVVGTSPTNTATGVAVASSITATFSEAIQSSTVSPSTFILKNSAGTSISGSVSVSADGKTGIFKPSSPLAFSTSYTATITTGVKDLAGNALASAKSWSFSTASQSGNTIYDDFESGTYTLPDGGKSPNGKWEDRWNGYGNAGVKSINGNNFFYEIPKTSVQTSETHSSLVVTSQKYSDFTLDLDLNTYKQLRQNSPPNTWETAWVFWRVADLYHSYYFVLKTNGIEFGKKDNNCNCEEQVFLKTGPSPTVKLGTWAHVKISSLGKHTVIWVDGTKVVDMDDPSYNSAQMSSGNIGLYNEDASVGFDNVRIGTP
jgi:hypothetical protein